MTSENAIKNILGKHILTDGRELILDIEKSHGSWIADKQTGREYLDLYSMYASQCIGYNHPGIIEIEHQLGKAARLKPTNSEIYTQEYADFVQTFSRIGIPEYLPHAFFIEGGALAVENALKAAFDWKTRKNISRGKSSEKGRQIIHFKDAFHGRSGYTISLTNTSSLNKTQFFPTFDWPRIVNPKLSFPLSDEGIAHVKKVEADAMAQIKSALLENKDDIAGLIIEPIQAEGGDHHFRTEFMQALKEICMENEMLFILDEVQTGVGITGKFWAHQHDEIAPDIISFGKKSQVCGILAGKRLDEVEHNVFNTSSRIASTWGGSLVDMVRFTQILKIMEAENLVENAREQGAFLLESIQGLVSEFPGLLCNPRGKGLMCAFDFVSGEQRDKFISRGYDEGLLLIGCGSQSLRFRPNLIVTRNELGHACEIMKKILATMS